MIQIDGDYFAALWSRRNAAVLPIVRAVRYRDGSAPIASCCHANVDRWVAENDGDSVVRGWLCLGYGFERHSLVLTGSGELIEITLPDPIPFLRHDGDEASFQIFAEAGNNQVLWPPVAGSTFRS